MPIFLDNHSTTRVDPRVRAAMAPFEDELCGNPSSPHQAGSRAARALAAARADVAGLVGADPAEVVFTASATEANNLALWGTLGALGRPARGAARRAVVVSAVEHKSVSEPARAAADHYGYDLAVAPVDAWGRVRLDDLRALARNAALVSVQLANNEVGTVQDLAPLAALAHAAGARFHVDATQGLGRVPFAMREAGADMVSFASHKIHGPKGAGALVVRGGLELLPLMQGGKQEGGLRPGTENVPALVGFGAACGLYRVEGAVEAARLAALRNALAEALAAALPEPFGVLGPFVGGVVPAARWPGRLPHNLSIRVPGVKGKELVAALADQVCVSTGAACNCPMVRSTDVLRAMGVSDEEGEEVVRFGVGRFTTPEDVAEAARLVGAAVRRLGRGRRAA